MFLIFCMSTCVQKSFRLTFWVTQTLSFKLLEMTKLKTLERGIANDYIDILVTSRTVRIIIILSDEIDACMSII